MKRRNDKILTVFILLCTIVVMSCGKNEVLSNDNSSSDDEYYIDSTKLSTDLISFSNLSWSTDETQTKGTVADEFRAGDNIGVYAYLIYEEDIADDYMPSSPNYMYNQLVEYNGISWSYSPQKYWPSNENDKLMFFGYSPHSADEEYTEFKENRDGFPILVHTTATSMVETSDLVLAGRRVTKAEYGTKDISLRFEHALSRIQFSFCNLLNSQKYKMLVSNITINNITNKSAFTYYEMSDEQIDSLRNENVSEDEITGMLLSRYLLEEETDRGTVTADVESGALIGLNGREQLKAGDTDFFESDGTPKYNGYYAGTDGYVYYNDGTPMYDGYMTDEDILNYVQYYCDDAYIEYKEPTDSVYNEPTNQYIYTYSYTDITEPEQYLFVDPYVVAEYVWLSATIDIYIEDEDLGYVDKTYWVSNTMIVDVTQILKDMYEDGPGHSYVWQLSYQPLAGSGLVVNAIETWQEISNHHDI